MSGRRSRAAVSRAIEVPGWEASGDSPAAVSYLFNRDETPLIGSSRDGEIKERLAQSDVLPGELLKAEPTTAQGQT
jgi:hypothetical protein